VPGAGGHLVIAHFDWIPLPGNIAEVAEKLIEKHNPAWKLGAASGCIPSGLGGWRLRGSRDLKTFSFDLDVPYSREGWRGRIRASAGIGASLSSEAIAAFDSEPEATPAERFGDEPLMVQHRVFAAIGTRAI